jgi:hypothetical protein
LLDIKVILKMLSSAFIHEKINTTNVEFFLEKEKKLCKKNLS